MNAASSKRAKVSLDQRPPQKRPTFQLLSGVGQGKVIWQPPSDASRGCRSSYDVIIEQV